MKALVLGDPHFGGGFNIGRVDPHRQINSRLIDQSNLFNYVTDYCVANGINTLILTGDIFESRRPTASETAIFAEKMARTSELEIHTHIVVGNHDITQAQNATTLDFLDELKLPFVHIYADIENVECGDFNFIFFPFRTRKMLKCRTNEEAIARLADRLNYQIEPNKTNILVGHLMLEGTNMTKAVMESHLSELVLPLDMFKGLDGVIMGHVHPHQIIRKDPLVCYVGSMFRKKFDEGGQKKYFLTISKEGELVFNFQSLPVRDLYDLTIDQSDADSSEQLLQGIKDFMVEFGEDNQLSGSIVRLQVHTNEKAVYGFHTDDVMSFLHKDLQVHNCVGVFPHITSKRQLRKETITERVDPQEAFAEFLGMEEDSDVKERARELGTRIISRSAE